jgi:predicted house-cleaning noncanonical NTP pyrophosphatase (MazG superfamily)
MEKLVRDYIPSIIADSKSKLNMRVAQYPEVTELLKYDKLTEEIGELREAINTGSYDDVIGEAADVMEVIASLVARKRRKEQNQYTRGRRDIEDALVEIISKLRSKADTRGGFSCGYVIEVNDAG